MPKGNNGMEDENIGQTKVGGNLTTYLSDETRCHTPMENIGKLGCGSSCATATQQLKHASWCGVWHLFL